MKGGEKMEKAEQLRISVGDKDAATVLEKYAVWHPELERKDLCSSCSHCIEGDHCQPCGTPET